MYSGSIIVDRSFSDALESLENMNGKTLEYVTTVVLCQQVLQASCAQFFKSSEGWIQKGDGLSIKTGGFKQQT